MSTAQDFSNRVRTGGKRELSGRSFMLNRVCRGTILCCFLTGSFLFFAYQWYSVETVGAYDETSASANDYEDLRSFSIEGEDMQQFFIAFGSEVLSDSLVGHYLNCDAEIVDENLHNGQGVLHVILHCDCEDADADAPDLDSIQSEWKILVNL